MNLNIVLLIYLILFIILIILFSKYGIRLFSSLVLTIIICWIFLNILMPPNEINDEDTSASSYSLYFLIQFLSFIIILIYAISMALTDFKSDYVTVKIHSKYINPDNSLIIK